MQETDPALLTNQLDDEAAKVTFSLLSHTEFTSFCELILDAFHLPLGWSQRQNHILLTHLFIAQLLLLRERHLMCSSKETEGTFHFLLIDESVTECKSCSPHLQYPGGVIRDGGNSTGIQLGSGLRAEASRAVKLCPVLFAWKEQCKVNIDAVL